MSFDKTYLFHGEKSFSLILERFKVVNKKE